MAARKRKICDEGDLLAVIEEELWKDSDSVYFPELSSSSSVRVRVCVRACVCVCVCGTTRINRGLPRDMIEEAKMLKKGEVTFVGNRMYFYTPFKISVS
jgi:hypothetical protein